MTGLAERLQRLGREIAAEQDRALAQDLSLGSVRARVIAKPLRRSSRTKLWAAGATVTAVAAAMAVYGFTRSHAPLAATLGGHPLAVGEWVSATDAGSPPIHFSDGSEVTLSPGSRARLATLVEPVAPGAPAGRALDPEEQAPRGARRCRQGDGHGVPRENRNYFRRACDTG